MTATRRIFTVLGWTLLVIALGILTVLFWVPAGLLLLASIVVSALFAIVRAMIRDLRGYRPSDDYHPGPSMISQLQSEPKRIRHFTVPAAPTKNARDL